MSLGDDGTSPEAPTTLGATTLNIKFPEFWSSDSELWFLTAESIFRKSRITSSLTKFDYVVAALPQSTASVVRDILRSPPADQPYETLRKELIRRTTESEQRRLQQLLTAEELGDRKPTELLRRMEHLLGDKATTMDTSIFKELFLQRLPSQVRMILSTSATDSISTLARMADQIMDVGSPTISAVRQETPSTSCTTVTDIGSQLARLLSFNDHIEAKVSELSREIRNLQSRPSRSLTVNPRTNAGRHHSESRAGSPLPRVCWYHQRYGSQARACRPPCNYSGNDMGTR